MARKEIFLEEAVLDDLSGRGLDVVERPFSDRAFFVLGWIVLGVVALAGLRVLSLSFFFGGFYQSRALTNAGQEIILPAPRGIIYDRFSRALVSNEPSFRVSVNLSELFKNPDRISPLLGEVSKIVSFDVQQKKDEIVAANLERQSHVVIARDLSLNQVIALKKLEAKELLVEEDFSRVYENGPEFSQILGYTGATTRDDVARSSDLSLQDEIGKSGLESVYDEALRGQKGFAYVFRDAKGNVLEEKRGKEPVAGLDLHTTIDADLQEYFSQTLSDQLHALGRSVGVGIAINPQTGEILSLVSLPSYDNNNLSSSLFTDPHKPTFNRAISGIYSPGSTIKPLVAFGALEEEVINPLKEILSIGYIEIPNPYDPAHPSRFVDWKPQGWVNMYSALARSSNVYFYEVGGGFSVPGQPSQEGLGVDRLKTYWEKFLLDQPTGIDLAGEVSGFLPDPQIKEERTGDIWRIGDTYNVSIGQGDLLISPMELIRYIAGIASKGTLPTPYLVDYTQDKNGVVEKIIHPTSKTINAKDRAHFDEVERGMLDAVEKDYGTAHLLSTIPMTIAAKTGSAQTQNNQKTNAFFVGYGPVPNPNIAVLVLIEDAKEGSLNAVPVAQKVFEWYYEHRVNITDKKHE